MNWIAKLASEMIKEIFSYLVIATTPSHIRKRWAQQHVVDSSINIILQITRIVNFYQKTTPEKRRYE